MNWIYNDGGRYAEGFKGQAGDCLCRSIAIVLDRSYSEIYDIINEFGRLERKSKRRKSGKSTARGGVYKATASKVLAHLGLVWTPTMSIGSGCQVHMRENELPSKGRLVVSLSQHYTAVIDGEIYDTHDPSRNGTRCVYGYWTMPE